jgi:hypothetical protein
MAHNFHSNAAALIIAAAKKSGLLDGIAEALCFIDKVPYPSFDCPACELLGNLADAFDEHAVLPNLTIEQFYGEGVDIPRYTEEELRPYFSVPFDVHVATTPPRFDIDFNKIFPIDSTPIANT